MFVMDKLEVPHGHNLRYGRFSEAGQAYLITAVTRERQALFRELALGRLVVAEFQRIQDEGQADTLAFVVMPDHVHWLLVLQRGTLAAVVGKAKARSAKALNRILGREGAIWQAGFFDHALRQAEDLPGIARYVVANPLRAGLVQHIGDYPLWDAVWL